MQYNATNQIQDINHFLFTAITGGTSGTLGNRPFFETHEAQNTILLDNAVVWTESHPSRATTTPYVLNAIVLNTPGTPGAHVEQVSLAGTTGPGAMATAFSTGGGTVIDGLQWQDQSGSPQVIARYRVNSHADHAAVAGAGSADRRLHRGMYVSLFSRRSQITTSPGCSRP